METTYHPFSFGQLPLRSPTSSPRYSHIDCVDSGDLLFQGTQEEGVLETQANLLLLPRPAPISLQESPDT